MSYLILILLSFLFYSSYTFSCKSDNLSVVRVPFSREKCTILFKMHNSMPKKLQETIFRIPKKKPTLFVHVYHPYLFYQCSVPPISSRDFKKKHIMLRKKMLRKTMLGIGLCQNQSQFKKIFSSEHHNTKKFTLTRKFQTSFKNNTAWVLSFSCYPHPRDLRF